MSYEKKSNYFHIKKDRWIRSYLQNMMQPVVERYISDTGLGEATENAPIFICWWSGENQAPDLVKQCIKSIRKNAGTHPVLFISETTYGKYVQVPIYIADRVYENETGLAHFADYLRVCLLEKYGGLWLDATIFCADTIPEEYFNLPVFTCKIDPVESRYISKHRWVTFCLGGWKHNPFYIFLKEAFELYWKQEKQAIDYLFFDYLIDLAVDKIQVVEDCMTRIPINNLHRDDLQAAMHRGLPQTDFDQVLCADTVVYKLSWRETYETETPDGEKSVYAHFLELDIT